MKDFNEYLSGASRSVLLSTRRLGRTMGDFVRGTNDRVKVDRLALLKSYLPAVSLIMAVTGVCLSDHALRARLERLVRGHQVTTVPITLTHPIRGSREFIVELTDSARFDRELPREFQFVPKPFS